MYICICKKITDSCIIKEVETGARTVNEISDRLGAATQCGKCRKCVRKVVEKQVAEMNYFPADLVMA